MKTLGFSRFITSAKDAFGNICKCKTLGHERSWPVSGILPIMGFLTINFEFPVKWFGICVIFFADRGWETLQARSFQTRSNIYKSLVCLAQFFQKYIYIYIYLWLYSPLLKDRTLGFYRSYPVFLVLALTFMVRFLVVPTHETLVLRKSSKYF